MFFLSCLTVYSIPIHSELDSRRREQQDRPPWHVDLFSLRLSRLACKHTQKRERRIPQASLVLTNIVKIWENEYRVLSQILIGRLVAASGGINVQLAFAYWAGTSFVYSSHIHTNTHK